MKKFFKLITFAIWMYGYIFYMWAYYTRVNKARILGDVPNEIDEIRKLQHKWGLGVTGHYKIKINVSGLEKIPTEPVLFVSNHQSFADIPIFVAAIDRQIGFIAKYELSKIPLFGDWIKAVRSVFIHRGAGRESLKAIEEAIVLLNKGYTLGVFAEGTRSRGPNTQEFKKGSLKLAVKAGVKVVPVAINGSYVSFEKNGYPTPCTVEFVVMDPIDTTNLSRQEGSNLAETVETIIRAKLDELQNRFSE